MRLRAANRNHRRAERRRVQALTEGGGFLIPADFLIELRASIGPFVEIEGEFRVIDDDEVVAIPHFAGFDGDEDEDEE